MIVDSLTKKKTGSHYTTDDLSKFMADKLISHFNDFKSDFFKDKINIIDPSCGEGSLLYHLSEKLKHETNKIIGIDNNYKALETCSKNLAHLKNLELINEDYIEMIVEHEKNKTPNIFSINHQDEKTIDNVDLIIANPPYVRTQVLGAEKSKTLSKEFNLAGRVDLYQVFLVAMTKHLRENGLICVITSNRYLTTAGGKDIRKFLNKNYEILEILDLGDTKLFEAAVLPAIFIGRKKKKQELLDNKNVKFTRIYEYVAKEKNISNINLRTDLFELLNERKDGLYRIADKNYELTTGTLTIPTDENELWKMATEAEKKWSDSIKSNAKYIFEDVFKVKVGIKTTADSVFIRKNWSDESLIPEHDLIFPLVSSHNIQKWNTDIKNIDREILYTHKNSDGKKLAIDLNEYPNAKAYLNKHRERLEGRSYIHNSKRNWYEIWVPQNPGELGKKKVIFPDISPVPKFSLDLVGNMVDGNCYWLTLKEGFNEELLFLATAVANSSVMNKFHEIEFQNVLYSGRKRYLTQYVKNYLLPDPSNPHSKNAISLVRELLHNNFDSREIINIERKIDLEIEKSFMLG